MGEIAQNLECVIAPWSGWEITVNKVKYCCTYFSLYSEYTFMLKFLQLFVTHHAKMVDAVFCLVTAPVHLAG